MSHFSPQHDIHWCYRILGLGKQWRAQRYSRTVSSPLHRSRCCLVISRGDYSSQVMYGQCEDLQLLRFHGQWAVADATRQGTFSFKIPGSCVSAARNIDDVKQYQR